MSEYFDNLLLQLGIDGQIDRAFVDAQELNAVVRFHEIADAYRAPNANDYDNASVLADPAWREVVTAAREARERLFTILTDPAELALLVGERGSVASLHS